MQKKYKEMENRFKTEKGGRGRNIFARVERALNIDGTFDGLPVKFFPYVLFLFLLALIYIGNGHYAEKSIRKINRLEIEVEDLRADYTTLKAEYMLMGKQSEIAEKSGEIGLNESMEPPYKIVERK